MTSHCSAIKVNANSKRPAASVPDRREAGLGVGEGHNLDAGFLAFLRPAAGHTHLVGIGSPAIDANMFGDAAGTDEKTADGLKIGHVAAGFLKRLAPGGFLRGFAGVTDAAERLQLPAVMAREMGTGAELLDQDNRVPLRVIGQNGGGGMALEHLAFDFRAPVAVQLAKLVDEARQPAEPVVKRLAGENANAVAGHIVQRIKSRRVRARREYCFGS